MGAKVDSAISKVMATGKSKGSAIAILKSQGTIKQKGAHLTFGFSKKKGGSRGKSY